MFEMTIWCSAHRQYLDEEARGIGHSKERFAGESNEISLNSLSLLSFDWKVEEEEEYLTNTLQKKLHELEKDKTLLELQLEEEQEFIVNKLQRQLGALQSEKRFCASSAAFLLIFSQLEEKIEELQRANSDLE